MIEIKTFHSSLYSMTGISKKAVEEHLKLYAGYVNKYNEITEKLQKLTDEDYEKANQVYSAVRSLKMELSFAWGGVVNHELYFSQLGGNGALTNGALAAQIEKDFGSFDAYKKDMKASALAARGWVWTIWSGPEQRLINHIGDSQNTYAFWGGIPVVALDTYEHAYFLDYGVNRSKYVDAYFENFNWEMAEKAFLDK